MDDFPAAEPGILARLMVGTTKKMLAELEETRDAMNHAATKGSSNEEAVREFLKRRLPESIGVTTGQVVDSLGGISKQLDVILYNRERTPMLFTSPGASHDTVPIEGVIGAVEVKTQLAKDQLTGILENCRSVKTLTKRAYFGTAVAPRYRSYGREWDALPVYYAVFGFESAGLYADELNIRQKDLPLHERIDLGIALDRGTLMNVKVDGLPTEAPTFHPTPEPGTILVEGPQENALLHWCMMLTSQVVQARSEPINLLPYAGEELRMTGRIGGVTGKEFEQEQLERTAAAMGVDVALLTRFMAKGTTASDLYHLLRSPKVHVNGDAVDPRLRALRELARNSTLEQWIVAASGPSSVVGQVLRDGQA